MPSSLTKVFANSLYRAAFYAVFDLKILFISSVVLFEVGSVLCGAAPSMNALIVGRVIAGIGGSGVYIGYELLSSIWDEQTV